MIWKRTAQFHLNRWRKEARVDNIRLPLSNRIISPGMEWTLAKGRYEWGEARMSARVLKPGESVLELGAGIGFVSSYIRLNTDAGQITCIEANPDLVPYIEGVHRLNGISNAAVVNGVAQVADYPASIPFYCRKDFWASSMEPAVDYERAVEVPVLNFTNLLATARPDVLVMDIEGAELDLLEADTLPHVRAIVLEVHKDVYGRRGLDRLFERAKHLGFHRDPNGTVREVHTLVRN